MNQEAEEEGDGGMGQVIIEQREPKGEDERREINRDVCTKKKKGLKGTFFFFFFFFFFLK